MLCVQRDFSQLNLQAPQPQPHLRRGRTSEEKFKEKKQKVITIDYGYRASLRLTVCEIKHNISWFMHNKIACLEMKAQ